MEMVNELPSGGYGIGNRICNFEVRIKGTQKFNIYEIVDTYLF